MERAVGGRGMSRSHWARRNRRRIAIGLSGISHKGVSTVSTEAVVD